MRRLPPESIHALHQAALQAGLERDSLLAGIDRVLVAQIDLARSPSEQIHRDLHQLNEIPRGEGGADPLDQWLRNAQALSVARAEAKTFAEHLTKLATAPEAAPAAGDRVSGAVSDAPPVTGRGGAAGRWTGTLQQRARVEEALSAVPARDWTPGHHVCPSCGYDGVLLTRLRRARTWAIGAVVGALVLLGFLRGLLPAFGISMEKGQPAADVLNYVGVALLPGAYLVTRHVVAGREGRRGTCPFCESVVSIG